MVNIEYANAYSEVIGILKFLSQEDYEKIPKEKINLFETNANKDYVFEYNPDKTLQKQDVSKIARTIIAILFRDYWATEEQRNKIKAFQNNKRHQIEEENRQKYDTDIFKSKNSAVDDNKNEQTENMQLVEYKENIFKRILGFFKKMLKK
jgi:hypothetical protein